MGRGRREIRARSNNRDDATLVELASGPLASIIDLEALGAVVSLRGLLRRYSNGSGYAPGYAGF